jgi:glycosyltransferase involved in cell wall biosynthesis
MLFISFIDFGDMSSGSSVRPQRMYHAFEELGYEINLLSGLQNRKLERNRNVYKKYRELKKNGLPDFCYVEPPSGPFFNLCDHLLLIWLKLKGVPIGLFYRDAYWKFADWWQVKGLKRFFIVKMQQFDLFIIKRTCKVVFFPTKSMADLFVFKEPSKGILPPAGDNMILMPHENTNNVVYVGGVSHRYGTDILLEAFEILNEQLHIKINLKLVCREAATSVLFEGYRNRHWLEIINASGEALKSIYNSSDIAVFSGRRDVYMDFSMPVKLFEYMSYGLPVVTTNCVEAASFVKNNGIGLVAKDNAQSLAENIARLYKEPELKQKIHEQCIKTLLEGNLWQHRAKQAANEIMGN